MQFVMITLDAKYISIDITDEMTMKDFEETLASKFSNKVNLAFFPPITYNGSDNCKAFLIANGIEKGNVVQRWHRDTNEISHRVCILTPQNNSPLTIDDVIARYTKIEGIFDTPKPVFLNTVSEPVFKEPALESHTQAEHKKLKSDLQTVRENNRLGDKRSVATESRENERKVSGKKL